MIRLDHTDAIVKRLPRLSLSSIRKIAGSKLSSQRQLALIDLAIAAWNGSLPTHSSGEGFSIPWQRLQEEFGDTRQKGTVQQLLALVFVTTGEYSVGVSRSYVLKHSVKEILDSVLGDDPHAAWPVFDPISGRDVFLSPDRSGCTELYVPEIITISANQIIKALVALQQLIAERGADALYDPDESNLTLHQVYHQHLLPLASWQASSGGVANRYVVGRDGRLYAESGAPHVITMPRVVRALLFKGTGLIDLDIANCGPSMLQSLARGHDIVTPVLDDYIAHREPWLTRLQAVTGDSRDDVKQALLSLLNGGQIGTTEREAGEYEGAPSIPSAYRLDALFMALQQEFSTTFGALFDNHISETWNLVGRPLSIIDKTTGKERPATGHDWRCKRRHVIAGAEQLAIRILCQFLRRSVVAVIFDGAIVQPEQWTVQGCEQHIERVSSELLGYPLKVRLKAAAF